MGARCQKPQVRHHSVQGCQEEPPRPPQGRLRPREKSPWSAQLRLVSQKVYLQGQIHQDCSRKQDGLDPPHHLPRLQSLKQLHPGQTYRDLQPESCSSPFQVSVENPKLTILSVI